MKKTHHRSRCNSPLSRSRYIRKYITYTTRSLRKFPSSPNSRHCIVSRPNSTFPKKKPHYTHTCASQAGNPITQRRAACQAARKRHAAAFSLSLHIYSALSYRFCRPPLAVILSRESIGDFSRWNSSQPRCCCSLPFSLYRTIFRTRVAAAASHFLISGGRERGVKDGFQGRICIGIHPWNFPRGA